MWKLIGVFLCVQLGAALADECLCAQKHPQNAFCSSDFVIQASILEITYPDPGADDAYLACTLRIHKVFKHPEGSEVLNEETEAGTLYVDNEAVSACGFTPAIRTKYVLAGSMLADGLHINMCDLHTPWDELKKQQRRGFHRKYGNNCMCQAKACFSCPTKEPNECLWYQNPPYYQDCYAKHSACELQEDGHCQWTNPSDLRDCKRDTEEEYQESVLESIAEEEEENDTRQRWLRRRRAESGRKWI